MSDGVFDEALAAFRARGAEGARAEMERARDEFDVRIDRVERLRHSPGWAHRLVLRTLPFFFPGASAYSTPWIGVWVTWLFLGGVLFSTGLIVLLPPLLALLCVLAWIQWLHAQSVIGRWDGRLCSSCAYDVSTLPDVIPGIEARGHRAGPEVCPECGQRWPLVPRKR